MMIELRRAFEAEYNLQKKKKKGRKALIIKVMIGGLVLWCESTG